MNVLRLALIVVMGWALARAGEGKPAFIEMYFRPPAQFANQFGAYRSPLQFENGSVVKTAAQWPARRAEILTAWNRLLGSWPPLLDHPRLEILSTEQRENFRQQRVRSEAAPGQSTEGWLLTPPGVGPFPAVLVVFYEPETSIGLKGKQRDFALQLTRSGFVTLSIGTPAGDAWHPDLGGSACQPLSYYAYVAANCHTMLAQRPEVDPRRIGITGHSYGGKWALFAAALYEKFAACAVSDPGIVWDETRANVNYWEPWYLGSDPLVTRKPGLPGTANPPTGAYKKLLEEGRDLVELEALLAPRPFLVGGGAEDKVDRWVALNHLVRLNQLLGAEQRVGLTTRPLHDPSVESNAVLCAFFRYFLDTAHEFPGN